MAEKRQSTDEQAWGCRTINPRACETCANRHGTPPFADMPRKAYCAIYTKESGMSKPGAVYYEGADCPFYVKG